MLDISSYNPETERDAERTSSVTAADVRRYAVEHSHDQAFRSEMEAGVWELADILPSFETQCDILRREGSHELRRVRELTRFIDRETRSGGYLRMNELEMLNLVSDEGARRFRTAPKSDSMEFTEAESEHQRYTDAVNAYRANLGIEPILGLIEENVAELNYNIDRESRVPNKNPADERKRLGYIKKLEAERMNFRRARILLLEQYFAPGSLH